MMIDLFGTIPSPGLDLFGQGHRIKTVLSPHWLFGYKFLKSHFSLIHEWIILILALSLDICPRSYRLPPPTHSVILRLGSWV